MPIALKHQCGQILRLSIDMAGKVGRCPQCGARIEIPDRETLMSLIEEAGGKSAPPQPGEPLQDAASARTAKATADFADTPLDGPASVDAKDPQIEFPGAPEVPEDSLPKPKCPNCGNEVAPDAIICIGCGTNLKTGERIQTKMDDTPKPDKEASGEPKKDDGTDTESA